MPIFRVQSGKLNTTVRAVNHKTAAIVGVNKFPGKTLDILITVTGKDEYETFATQKILDDMQCPAWNIEDQN